ncbi:DUF551 domain-containing protein [Klebsiella quasipneumoniae]|uniref:DUF551 domain-containing protein n=1 Tax=Klebsiella quasipneumoniae TaxID=1463165 RepID=UPI0039C343AC
MTSKFSIDNRELLQRISSGEAVVGIDFGNLIVRELAAFRLAAMDSEPVAWTWQHLKQWHVTNAEERARDLAWDGVKVEPLYRHAQQPVDSEPVGYLFHNEYGAVLYSISDDATEGFSLIGPIYSVPQPAPVVPGKWIPVSERMPEVGDIVLTAMGGVVNVGETECSAANCRFFTSVISGRELPATHWMQLPAAPQEVGDA